MSDPPLFVGRLMTSPARTVSRETTLAAAAAKLHRHGIGSAAVVDPDTRIEGIITATDLVAAAAAGADPNEATVGAYLTEDVLTTAADEPAVEAARRMARANVNHLPVVDENDGIVGMLTSTDLTDHIASDGVPAEPEEDEDADDGETADADTSGADVDDADADDPAAGGEGTDERDDAPADDSSDPTTANGTEIGSPDPATED